MGEPEHADHEVERRGRGGAEGGRDEKILVGGVRVLEFFDLHDGKQRAGHCENE